MQVTAIAIPSDHIQELISAWLAPAAAAAWKTMAAELVKPTSTVTKPAESGAMK